MTAIIVFWSLSASIQSEIWQDSHFTVDLRSRCNEEAKEQKAKEIIEKKYTQHIQKLGGALCRGFGDENGRGSF